MRDRPRRHARADPEPSGGPEEQEFRREQVGRTRTARGGLASRGRRAGGPEDAAAQRLAPGEQGWWGRGAGGRAGGRTLCPEPPRTKGDGRGPAPPACGRPGAGAGAGVLPRDREEPEPARAGGQRRGARGCPTSRARRRVGRGGARGRLGRGTAVSPHPDAAERPPRGRKPAGPGPAAGGAAPAAGADPRARTRGGSRKVTAGRGESPPRGGSHVPSCLSPGGGGRVHAGSGTRRFGGAARRSAR